MNFLPFNKFKVNFIIDHCSRTKYQSVRHGYRTVANDEIARVICSSDNMYTCCRSQLSLSYPQLPITAITCNNKQLREKSTGLNIGYGGCFFAVHLMQRSADVASDRRDIVRSNTHTVTQLLRRSSFYWRTTAELSTMRRCCLGMSMMLYCEKVDYIETVLSGVGVTVGSCSCKENSKTVVNFLIAA